MGGPEGSVGKARLFAVLRTRGSAWNDAVPMEGQADWNAHAVFMDGLSESGFIACGGPLEGSPDVLLIVRATDVAQVTARFAEDPWTASGLLTITRIDPWTLRLGNLDEATGPSRTT